MNLLTLTVQPGGESEGARVTATGDIDLTTVAQFRQALLPAALHGPVIVDITGVDFLDSAGMLVLLDAAKLTGRDGCKLLCRAHSQPARALTLAGFYAAMHIEVQEKAVQEKQTL